MRQPLLRRGRTLTSAMTGRQYRVGALLGRGGFGETSIARVVRPQRPRREVALKATLDQAAWLREAYFAELLSGQPRVIEIEDVFSVRVRRDGRERPVFCLCAELAEHGDLASYLRARGRGYTPRRAVQEIRAVLKVLDLLHGSSARHGDVSPANVLVTSGGRLKLADFGVAGHWLSARKPPLTGWNSWFAPWGYRGRAVDDVYFVGQILAMMLAGDASHPLDARAVNRLPVDEGLRRVIREAIGPATRRYEDAATMLAALARLRY